MHVLCVSVDRVVIIGSGNYLQASAPHLQQMEASAPHQMQVTALNP